MTELHECGARELATLIRSGEVSSSEVVEAHLDRIVEINPAVNAITRVLAEEAREAAKMADSKPAEGPLHGVPFTIKENIDCVGSATTQGVPAMAEALPPLDAPVVERMRAAGAIPLARTNLPEFGLRISTDNPLHGLTRNPWHPDLTAGGSSGGEASALATGMSPIGLGNDIGGSLRNPAFCCGVMGLKPTSGRVPGASSLPPEHGGIASQLMAVEGPMARRVDDLRVGLQVLAGRHPRDPDSVDAPLTPSDDAPKRCAVVTTLDGQALSDDVAGPVRSAAAALASAGWEIEEVEPPELDAVHDAWHKILAFEIEALIPLLALVMDPAMVEAMHAIAGQGRTDAAGLGQAFIERQRLRDAWRTFMTDFPVVLTPGWNGPPFEHGTDLAFDGPDDPGVISLLRFVTPANVLGFPAVAMPAGLINGVPAGIQIYADHWCEERALKAADAIESDLGRLTPIDPTFTAEG